MANLAALAAAFDEKYGSYDGWTFDFMRPGAFAYHHPEKEITIFFTPENSEEGVIDIAVSPEPGVENVLAAVGYDAAATGRAGNLTPEYLFASVKGWLDMYRR